MGNESKSGFSCANKNIKIYRILVNTSASIEKCPGVVQMSIQDYHIAMSRMLNLEFHVIVNRLKLTHI